MVCVFVEKDRRGGVGDGGKVSGGVIREESRQGEIGRETRRNKNIFS